jgi:hypothetical protein
MVATKMPGKRGRLPNEVTMRVEECLATPKALDSGGVEKRSAKAAVGTRIVVGFIFLYYSIARCTRRKNEVGFNQNLFPRSLG